MIIVKVVPISVNFISATALDASYAGGTNLSIKIGNDCESVKTFLDFPVPNSQTAACSLPAIDVYTDDADFSLATKIYIDACFITPAADGWWNDGVIRREWNNFILGPPVPCGANQHGHIRYYANISDPNGQVACTEPQVTVYQDASVVGSTNFSFYHPIWHDNAFTQPSADGHYSDGTSWRTWRDGAWHGVLYSCETAYEHTVRYRPPGQQQYICNAPTTTIYQIINTLTLGNNTYKPYTDVALTTLSPARWFTCCMQQQGQSQFYAYFWTGATWSGTYTCQGNADNDVIQFLAKYKPWDDLSPSKFGYPHNWDTQDTYKSNWAQQMCGSKDGQEPNDSVYVYQKKVDECVGTNCTEGQTIDTSNFSFNKPLYKNDSAETIIDTAMYKISGDNDTEYYAAWIDQNGSGELEGKQWRPGDGNAYSCSEGDKGCILEGSLITLADNSTVKVEELWEKMKRGVTTRVLTKESVNILNSDKDLELEPWNYVGDITWTDGRQHIITILQYTVDTLYEIEFTEVSDVLKTSWDHWNLIMRDTNKWSYKRSCQLEVGDSLPYKTGGNITVKSIKISYGVYNTYRVDVSGNNLFIANNILTHNASDDGDDGKKGGR